MFARAQVAAFTFFALTALPGAFFAATPSALAAPQEGEIAKLTGDTVKHDKTGYTFQTPKGWKIDKGAKGNITVTAPEGGSQMAVISFTGDTMTGAPSVEAITKILRDIVEGDKDLSGLKILSESRFTTSEGLVGARLEFQAKYEGEQVRGIFHGFVKNGSSAIFTALTTVKSSAKNIPLIDAVARSLNAPGR